MLQNCQGYKKIWKILENITDWRTLKRCNNQMLWGIINSSETVVISLSGGYCGFSSFQRLIVKWNICYSLALLLAILEVKQIRKHHCQLIHKVLLKIQGIIFMEMAVCDRECFGLKKKKPRASKYHAIYHLHNNLYFSFFEQLLLS